MKKTKTQLEKKISNIINKGLNNKIYIPINEIQFIITNRCNLHCIMCHACSSEYTNRTYNNQPPYTLSLKEYKKKLNYSFIDQIQSKYFKKKLYKIPKSIAFSSAESLININIYSIIKYTKKYYPQQK